MRKIKLELSGRRFVKRSRTAQLVTQTERCLAGWLGLKPVWRRSNATVPKSETLAQPGMHTRSAFHKNILNDTGHRNRRNRS
jgi:hypothetical protein